MTTKFLQCASLLAISALGTGCSGWMDGSHEQESTRLSLSSVVCDAQPLEVIVKGRENRFGLGGQQVALNPGIPMDRICRAVSAGCTQTCFDAKAAAEATGIKGFQDVDPVKLRQMGVLADTFNAALGIDTNFSALGEDGADQDGDGADAVCDATLLQVIVQGREHRFGFDGRQVALNPAIPMQNICQRLQGECREICDDARADAIATGIKGFTGDFDIVKLRRMGELADDFNAALGKQTNFSKNVLGVDRDLDDEDGEEAAAGGGGAAPAACGAKALEVLVQGREHRFGFDGRQVALNPAIPMQNICQRLQGECREICGDASEAAIRTGIKGFTGTLDAAQLRAMGELADDFNAALGNSTSFAANPILLR